MMSMDPETTGTRIVTYSHNPELTDNLIEKLAGAISAWNYISTACAYVGLSRNLLYSWLRRGARDRAKEYIANDGLNGSIFARLHRAVEYARAISEMKSVMHVRKAAEGGAVLEERIMENNGGSKTTVRKYAPPDWRAAAWFLSRAHREKWGDDAAIAEHAALDDGDDSSDPRAIEASFLPDPRRRLALRVAASRMLEREKERMAALAAEGKAAESVDRTGVFQGGAAPGDAADESISDHGLTPENGLQGDSGRSLEGDAALGGGSGLQSDGSSVGTGDRQPDDKILDTCNHGELVTDGAAVATEKTHAHAFAASDLEVDDAATERPAAGDGLVVDWEE